MLLARYKCWRCNKTECSKRCAIFVVYIAALEIFDFGKKTFEANGLKYDRLIQNSSNIVYFGHVRFPALLEKLSKLQQ